MIYQREGYRVAMAESDEGIANRNDGLRYPEAVDVFANVTLDPLYSSKAVHRDGESTEATNACFDNLPILDHLKKRQS